MPFALVHWSRGSTSRAAFAKPASLVSLTFLVPNLPFIVRDPSSWFKGIFAPVGSGAIPFGSGLVQIISIPHVEESARFFSYSWLFVLATLVVAYACFPRRLHFLPFVAPPIALFFSPRSLQNYFLYWPVLLGAIPQIPRVALPDGRFDRASVADRRFRRRVRGRFRNHAYVSIDDRVSRPVMRQRGRFAYLMIPGKLDQWNDFEVDLTAFPGFR